MSSETPTGRQLVLGALLVALLVAGALAAPTFAARQTVLSVDRVAVADATTEVTQRNGTTGLAVELTVANPTPHALTLVYGQLVATDDRGRLTRLTTTPFDRATPVPAGGEASVETFLPVGAGDLGAVRAALDAGRLTIGGYMRATVVREPIDVEVSAPMERAGG
jgi:hypothetical protein